MADNIGILLYNNFIELPGLKHIFGKKHRLFSLPRARQVGRKEHATQCVVSEDLRKFKGKSKENNVTMWNRTTRKTFLLFYYLE